MSEFRELTDVDFDMRIRANRRLPELTAYDLELSGWEPVISFYYDRTANLHHQETILRETQITKSGRFLPLHSAPLTMNRSRDPLLGYGDWFMFPNHPLPEVREETLQAATELCAGVLQLRDRKLVEVTFVAPGLGQV